MKDSEKHFSFLNDDSFKTIRFVAEFVPWSLERARDNCCYFRPWRYLGVTIVMYPGLGCFRSFLLQFAKMTYISLFHSLFHGRQVCSTEFYRWAHYLRVIRWIIVFLNNSFSINPWSSDNVFNMWGTASFLFYSCQSRQFNSIQQKRESRWTISMNHHFNLIY